MPAEDEFRAIFKAIEGRVIVQADYKQVELVVGCIIADDASMQAVFAAKQDIHSATAAKIAGDDYDEFQARVLAKDDAAIKLRKDGKPCQLRMPLRCTSAHDRPELRAAGPRGPAASR